MWSPVYQAGADVMKRIATPMIGGVITSAILNLLIYPVIYVIWKKRGLPPEPPAARLELPPQVAQRPSRRRVVAGTVALLVAAAIGATAYFSWSSGGNNSAKPMMPIAKVTQDGVTVSVLSADGQIYARDNSLEIKFEDQDGHPVNVENVKLNLNMNMPGMEMHSAAKMNVDSKVDSHQAHLTPDMAGDWVADLSYQGPKGPGKLTVPINVKQ
jgi:phosphate/sulfate permease